MSATFGEPPLHLPPDLRPRLASLGALKLSLDIASQSFARELRAAVLPILGAVAAFEDAVRALYRAVEDGQTASAHSARDRFLAAFEDRLRLLHEAIEQSSFAERVTAQRLPETEQLKAEAEALEKKLTKLATQWLADDQESLEYLVAEAMTPPASVLHTLAASHPPPQSWYDED